MINKVNTVIWYLNDTYCKRIDIHELILILIALYYAPPVAVLQSTLHIFVENMIVVLLNVH